MYLKFILGLLLCSSFYWFKHWHKGKLSNGKETTNLNILKPPDVEVSQPPSRSPLYVYREAAICSDKTFCSNIGIVILQQKGNVIDATISTLLCNGLVTMQSMGLGGGVIMTFYHRKEKKAITIIGRERAPLNIKFKDINQLQNSNSFPTSAMSIAVPGELAAYYTAHRRYGELSWSHIMRPILQLCFIGYQLTRHQYESLFLNEKMIRKNKLLTQIFIDSTTNLFYTEGWHIKLPTQVCDTYKLLAEEGAFTFYNGSLASLIVKDLTEMRSPITFEDLHSFKAQVTESIKVNLGPYYIYLPHPPGSGHIVGFVMKLLYNIKKKLSTVNDFSGQEVHLIAEALKFGFVKRWQYDTEVDYQMLENLFTTENIANLTLLIDDLKTFENPQHYGSQNKLIATTNYGTSQISVLGSNGDAVSATSSINYYFGSGHMGNRSGILFNNAMADFNMEHFENYFNLPNVKNVNEPKAGKQPMSSMAPLIVTNKDTGDVRLVVGAAGGSRIISTMVQILVRVLWQNQNIKKAIDGPRFHHQLVPNLLEYEFGMLQQVVQDLKERGHKTQRLRRKCTAVCGIERVEGGVILANADYRKEGGVDGF